MLILLNKAHTNGWKPPTPAQAKAGNYKKPRVRWQGLEISIENPAGSVRKGKGWRTKMKCDYGYIRASEGVDGDHVDVYLGPDLDAPTVYIVHQRKAGDWKAYDEDKCMIGFASEEEAKKAYLKHYDDARFLGPITAMTVEKFVEKVRATKDKPAMIKSMVLFLKGGKPGAPGLHQKLITDKRGHQVRHWVRMPQAEQLSFNFEGAYDGIDLRPDTKAAQTDQGRSALESLGRHVLGFRVDRAQAATLLGVRLSKDFIERGYTTLVGQKIGSAHDLATLAQVYRDPRFETFRVFFTGAEKVVGETAYSCRVPGAVHFERDLDRQLREDLQRFGADGYWMVHNHPSGSAQPSMSDVVMTQHMAKLVPGFKSHVVIDHNEYATIDANGSVGLIKDPSLGGADFSGNPALEHGLLGLSVTSPATIRQAAMVLQKKNQLDHPVIIMTAAGAAAEVSVIMSAPAASSWLSEGESALKKIRAWLRSIGRKTGSGSFSFLVVSDADLKNYRDKLKSAIADGVFTDVVSASGETLRDGTTPARPIFSYPEPTPARRKVVGFLRSA